MKPENTLVTREGIVKITDFGLAKAAHSTQQDLPILSGDPSMPIRANVTRMGQIVGTPQYMSPEQWLSESTDIRADIYSLGCMLFEMVAGRLVFDALNFAEWRKCHLEQKPEDLETVIKGLPTTIYAIIKQCLAKERSTRPSNFGIVQEALQKGYRELFGVEYNLNTMHEYPDSREWTNKGISLTILGRNEEALIHHDKALVLNSQMPEALNNKATTLIAR